MFPHTVNGSIPRKSSYCLMITGLFPSHFNCMGTTRRSEHDNGDGPRNWKLVLFVWHLSQRAWRTVKWRCLKLTQIESLQLSQRELWRKSIRLLQNIELVNDACLFPWTFVTSSVFQEILLQICTMVNGRFRTDNISSYNQWTWKELLHAISDCHWLVGLNTCHSGSN